MFEIDELNRIDQADDLHISPLRENGKTYGTPTWIWAVVVDGELYLRAFNGVNSSWYRSELQQRAGRIKAAGLVKDVTFQMVHREINNAMVIIKPSDPFLQARDRSVSSPIL